MNSFKGWERQERNDMPRTLSRKDGEGSPVLSAPREQLPV